MAKFYYPIEIVEMREQGLASPVSATYGRVRNNNTRNHQGWDLHAPVGTHCYAIAAGVVEWIKNSGSYGQQLGIRFFKDGSAETSAVFQPTARIKGAALSCADQNSVACSSSAYWNSFTKLR